MTRHSYYKLGRWGKSVLARVSNEERCKHEAYRELEELVSGINYNVEAIVVEGPHDKKTLRLLGYKRPILICSKRPHNELGELAAKKFSSVVILTDFDEQGSLLNKKPSKLFEGRGVNVDRFYRRRFQRLLKEAKILTIEGIYSIKLDLFLHGL